MKALKSKFLGFFWGGLLINARVFRKCVSPKFLVLRQGIIDSTGTETRQIFSLMPVTAKILQNGLPLLEME